MGKHLTEDITAKLAGKTFPTPGSGDDGKFLKYVDATSEFTLATAGGSFSGTLDDITDGTTYKKMSATEQSKLSGVEANANNYSHPANHSPSIITQDSSNRFVTDTEKSTWNGKSDLALGETNTTAYRGDRGKTAYDHSQATHAPSDAVSLTTVKADTDIASAISLKHSNSLDHSHSNKTTLDNIQEALTTTLKTNYDTAYTHSQSAHAPSNAEQNVQSDWNQADTGADDYIKNKPTIPTVSDTAYDATSWNGNTDAPTKNAVRDKIETMGGGVSLLDVYPVGAIYISVVSTSPQTLFGGTWSAFGAGKVLVGLDSGDASFDTVEETGGAKTHTLQTTEIPAHNHQILRERSATTGSATTQIARTADTSSTVDTAVYTENTGGDQAHNNLQPYITVYMFKRTA